MVKYCAWGTCRSDSRKPTTHHNGKLVTFHAFPNWRKKSVSSSERKTLQSRCRAWIHACGRPQHQLNEVTVQHQQNRHVCSLHFVDEDGPTEDNPVPLKAPVLPPSKENTFKKQQDVVETSSRSGRRTKMCKLPAKRSRASSRTSGEALPDHHADQTNHAVEPSVANTEDVFEITTSWTTESLDVGNVTVYEEATFDTGIHSQETWVAEKRAVMAELETLRREKTQLELEKASWVNQKTELEMRCGELQKDNELLKEENDKLQESLKMMRIKATLVQQKLQAVQMEVNWTPEKLKRSRIKGLYSLLTGFSEQRFLDIYKFLVPSEFIKPFQYVDGRSAAKTVPRLTQFLLVMIKLRTGLENSILAFAFGIVNQDVSVIFRSWVTYMSLRLAEIPMWPSREVILSHATPKYREDFPTTLVLLDATELRIERPSSLVRQSQCFSHYKGTNTLKCLVACSPNGSLLWVSRAFTGSMSDKDIVEKSGFLEVLKTNLRVGLLKEGDGIMADKGFDIGDGLTAINLKLNIPPFASTSNQMPAADVELTRKIAVHRIHVERLIGRIRTFKIIDRKIRICNMATLDQTWLVCAMLTRFMPFLVK